MVDHGHRLHQVCLVILIPELQRTILERTESIIEELVDRSRENHFAILNGVANRLEISRKHGADVRMIEHALEHHRVSVDRHPLKLVSEVAIVGIGPHRHTRNHARVELGRIQTPLLERVIPEKLLVQLPAYLADDHIFRCPDLLPRLRERLEETLSLFGIQFRAVITVDRVQIDRDRQKFAVDRTQDAMLVRPPLCELRQIAPDQLRIRVKDVRTVLVNQHPVLVEVVVGVTTDMIALVDDEDSLVM